MASDSIAERYAQAAFDTAKAEGRLEETLEQLTLIGQAMAGQSEVAEFLLNPGVDPQDKVGLFERALKGGGSPLVRSLVGVVVSMGRSEYLPEILRAFQAMVEKAQGRLRVVVRSARPLPDDLVERLRAALEQRERRQVVLSAAVDPGLVGGVQVLLDHRVIDSSIRRQLEELRERLHAVRVH